MKKLMTMLAAVATAFGLYAADPVSYGTSFEGIEAGTSIFDVGTEGAKWSQVGESNAVVKAYDGAKTFGGYRPLKFSGDNLKYLDVKTTLTKPLTRSLDAAWELTEEDYIFVDTLVKFTNFDEDPTIASDAKIAVWTKEIEENNVIVGTNLMVTAGNGSGGSTNITIGAFSDFAPDTDIDGWTRVTIKAIPNIGDDNENVGFVVYINGLNTGDIDQGIVGATAASDIIGSRTLNNVANHYNEKNALFLSRVTGGDYKTTVSAVEFDGQGQIDELLITSTEAEIPNFAAKPQFFTIDADEHVTKLVINTVEYTADKLPAVLPWTAATSAYDVEATYESGFVADTWTITAGTVANGTFTPGVGGASGMIVSKAAFVEITYMTASGEETIFAEDFADAMTKIADKTPSEGGFSFKLADALTSANPATIAKDVTLDLNGKTYTYNGESGYAFTVAEVASLTITDSNENNNGKIVVVNKDVEDFDGGIVDAFGSLAIQYGTYDGLINFEYTEGKTFEVSGGMFYDKEGGEQGAVFPYVDALVSGKAATWADNYWTVQDKQGFVITIATATNTSVKTVEQDGEEITPEGNQYTVYEGNIDITYEAAEGFMDEDGTTVFAKTVKVTEAGEIPAPAIDVFEPAAQIVDGKYFKTIAAALTAADNDDTVKFLKSESIADYTPYDKTTVGGKKGNVSTKAAVIDFNGMSAALVTANNHNNNPSFDYAGTGTLTYTGTNKTFTIKGGVDLWYGITKVSVPAGVDFKYLNMETYGQLTTDGGDGAVFTCTGCTFDNNYSLFGTTDAATGSNYSGGQSYHSNGIAWGGQFAKAIINGNTFHTGRRPSITCTGTSYTTTDFFVFGNTFEGTKNCHVDSEFANRYPAGQIYSGRKWYIENNTLQGEFVQGLFRAEGNIIQAMVLNGNTFGNGITNFWCRNNDQLTDNIVYGHNTATETGFDWTVGVYGSLTSKKEVKPAYVDDQIALPQGVATACAWVLDEENGTKPYCVEGTYYAELPELAAGQVIIVEPSIAKAFGITSTDFAVKAIDGKVNKFQVIAKPQALTIQVVLNTGVQSVKYDDKTYTETFTLENVAKGTELAFTEVTAAGDEYELSASAAGDLAQDGYTFTVAADLTNPNATITFDAATAFAVAYSTADDGVVAKYFYNDADISNTWDAAQLDGQYVKLFQDYVGSEGTGQRVYLPISTVTRINWNGHKAISKAVSGKPVAVAVAGEKYTTYTPYATLADAYAAAGANDTYLVTGTDVDLSTLTLTAAKPTFTGTLGLGYSNQGGVTGSFKADTVPACDWSCQATTTWGMIDNRAFSFVAEKVQQQVTFAANGGSDTQAAIPYYAGDVIVAPACTFTAPEKGTFNCWSNATTYATYAVGATLPTDVASYELVADWTIASSPWPTPDPAKPEAEAVAEAMEGAGFSEAAAAAIGTKAEYTAFQDYCTAQSIIPSEVGAAKDNAVLTYALGAAACNTEITSEDITITAYDQATGKLTVEIEGVTAGETINSAVLAKVLTAKGGAELKALSTENVNVTGYAPADGEVEVTVTPKAENPTAFFYQIELVK